MQYLSLSRANINHCYLFSEICKVQLFNMICISLLHRIGFYLSFRNENLWIFVNFLHAERFFKFTKMISLLIFPREVSRLDSICRLGSLQYLVQTSFVAVNTHLQCCSVFVALKLPRFVTKISNFLLNHNFSRWVAAVLRV